MTPFGERLRELRRAKGVSAEGDGGCARRQRGLSVGAWSMAGAACPTWAMLQKIIGYFNVIWDDAEELQRLR